MTDQVSWLTPTVLDVGHSLYTVLNPPIRDNQRTKIIRYKSQNPNWTLYDLTGRITNNDILQIKPIPTSRWSS